MAQQGQPTQRQGLKGMFILQDNAGCQVYKPTWQGTRTIFRPFPARSPENPEAWDPCRLSDDDGDWGDWIRRYDVAYSLGSNGYTFILKDPMQSSSIDDQQNPVWMLYRAVDQAVKSGQGQPSWNPLIFGGAGRPAALSAPKDGYVIQGILMEHRSNPKDPPLGCMMDHSPIVLLMSQSAGTAMLERLSEKASNGAWVYPDATDLDGGMFLQFHQAGTQRAPGADTPHMGAGGVGRGGVERNRYEVIVLDNYNGVPPSFPSIQEVAGAHVRNWDDIIRIPTIEEQVRLICNCGIPADAVTYALGDVYGEYIPQTVWEQSRNRQPQTTVPAPGMPTAQPRDVETTNPMQPTGMGAPAPTQTAPPAGSPAETAPSPMAPSSAPSPAVAETTGAPASAEEAPPATPETPPATQGFDPQPTHADPARTQSTMAALERARERAREAAGN